MPPLMTPFRIITAARLLFLGLASLTLSMATPGGWPLLGAQAGAAALLAVASAALAGVYPRGPGGAASAALLGVDVLWLALAAHLSGSPRGAELLLWAPGALAAASGGLRPALAVAVLAAAAQAALAYAAGANAALALARGALLPAVAAALAVAVDLEGRERLRRLKASLGSQRRLQVGELFQHTLFQVREYMTSVTSVTEGLALQAQGSPLADQLARLRALVHECNSKIARLMDTLRGRATSRRAETASAPFDVRELLLEAGRWAEELAAGGPVQALVECEDMPRLRLDRATVFDLVQMLVHNAVEALGSRGGRVLLTGRATASLVEIEVTDDGGGVPDELLGEVFQPLFTTKASLGGLGLGLSMARRVARSLGGNLELATQGRRTTARLSLPPEGGLPQVFTGDSTWAGRRGRLSAPGG